jgi:hypothetical protein
MELALHKIGACRGGVWNFRREVASTVTLRIGDLQTKRHDGFHLITHTNFGDSSRCDSLATECPSRCCSSN